MHTHMPSQASPTSEKLNKIKLCSFIDYNILWIKLQVQNKT